MIVRVEKSLAIAIHDRQLSEHGGSSGVRDEKLLESALAQPQQQEQGSLPRLRGRAGVGAIADLAASLAFGLARNHPFVDGNKRTAHVCYRVFLALNDIELQAGDEDKYVTILALAEGKLPEKDFAAWLRHHIRVSHAQQVQEPRAAPYPTRRVRSSTAKY